MRVSNEKQRLLMVAVSLIWCVALVLYQMVLASGFLSMGLLWNLFLAAVPLFWSAVLQWANARHNRLLSVVSFALWLLFLPNAPYILTDLVHLAPHPRIPLWYILAMLLSCAGTGTWLGYLSLLNVHQVIEQKFNRVAGWSVAISSLMLCGFGIYLGRFLRWNSWDVFINPLRLFEVFIGKFIYPGRAPHPLGVSLIFGVALILGYLAMRVFATSNRSELSQ